MSEIEINHQMFFRTHPFGILPCDRQLEAVPLAIGKADCVGGEAFVSGYRHTGGGIESAAVQYYRFTLHDMLSGCISELYGWQFYAY